MASYWVIIAVILGLALVSTLVSYATRARNVSGRAWTVGFVGAVMPQLWGAGVTALLVALIVTASSEQPPPHTPEAQTALINAVAGEGTAALEPLRAADLLNGDDGILRYAALWNVSFEGADLRFANLEGAKLGDANLERADLSHANLEHTDMIHANLRRADLTGARFNENTRLPDNTMWTPETDLTRFTDPEHARFWKGYKLAHDDQSGEDFSDDNLAGADLRNVRMVAADLQRVDLARAWLERADLTRANLADAQLEGVNFQWADLTSTNLEEADLAGANLSQASLVGANLNFAQFDETTIMPDGSPWTPETETARFTDSNHPFFWRSDDPTSPAHRSIDA